MHQLGHEHTHSVRHKEIVFKSDFILSIASGTTDQGIESVTYILVPLELFQIDFSRGQKKEGKSMVFYHTPLRPTP